MNDIYLIILIVLTVALIAYQFLSKNNSNASDQIKALKDLLQESNKINDERLDRTRKEILDRLFDQNKILNDQLDKSRYSIQQQFEISQKSLHESKKQTNEIIKDVTQKLTVLEKTNDQVVSFAKQMESLEKILKNPKQRGVLGEYFLETTLKNVLPPESFKMQYKFKNGETVDAVVFVKDKIIPIDSKFSLENYNRLITEENELVKEEIEKEFRNDLKKRIDETSKYIRLDESTMEFAFMFIPAEGIYYDLLINKVGNTTVNTRDLIQYAFAEKKVIIVSPTSFLAYLQTVMQGLRALQIEESAKQIRENVSKLAIHLRSYEENFDKIGKHLSTTVNSYNIANKELKKIDKDVYKISGDALEIKSEDVENPQIFD